MMITTIIIRINIWARQICTILGNLDDDDEDGGGIDDGGDGDGKDDANADCIA